MDAPAVGGRQQIARDAVPVVPALGGLLGKPEQAHRVVLAVRRGAQRQHLHPRGGTAQAHHGHVFVRGVPPALLQDHPLAPGRALGMGEEEPHRLAGAAFRGPDDVGAGDEDVLGHQEARPDGLPVRSEDLGHGTGQSRSGVDVRRLVGAVHRISPCSRLRAGGGIRFPST